MDDTRQVAQQGEKYVEPKGPFDPDGEEDTQRWKKYGNDDSEYAHVSVGDRLKFRRSVSESGTFPCEQCYFAIDAPGVVSRFSADR